MAERQLDLWSFLGQLSKRDLTAYDRLTDEQKKEAAAFVIMRWLTGTADPAQIVRLNTFVNPYAFSLGQEKGLLFKLLAASCTNSGGRYTWLKAPGSKSAKLRLEVIKAYYGVSTKEATGYTTVEDDTIIQMAEELGWDEEQLKKLKAEVGKDGPGRAEKAGGKQAKRR